MTAMHQTVADGIRHAIKWGMGNAATLFSTYSILIDIIKKLWHQNCLNLCKHVVQRPFFLYGDNKWCAGMEAEGFVKMGIGKVMLVGAGPGDPELLTLKAVRALGEADVVLVDDLVHRDILRHAPLARVVEVGKRGGCKSTPQHFINRMMIALAQQGQRVVRLKGGDPFLFGRGGEEMLALRAAGIEVEIIPGITSGTAVPASIGIPLTHRAFTHGVTFVTGHTQDGTPPNWRALVEGRTTLVIYMGLKNLPGIVSALLDAGLPEEAPAAVIQQGTQPQQQQVVTHIALLPLAVKQQGLVSPALIVVGEVAKLAQAERLAPQLRIAA